MGGKVGVATQHKKAAQCGMTHKQWVAARESAKTNKMRGRKAAGEGVDFSTPVEGQLDMFAE